MRSRLFATLLIFLSATVFAQTSTFPKPDIKFNPKKYICYRTYESMKIDGDLFDPPWLDTEWSDFFVDIEGEKKPNPYYNTRVKMLWDDVFFYFAAEIEDENIWATITTHDYTIYNDNDFEIFIDPDGDTHSYYEMEMNAFNTIWDLFLVKPYRDGRKIAITDWDMKGLKTGVKVYGSTNNAEDKDEKWTIEVAIPWKVFREMSYVNLPPKENDQWRVNFSRVQWETEIDNGKYSRARNPETNKLLPENNWVWSPQGLIAMHYPEMWGYVQFSYKVTSYGEDKFIPNKDEEIKWYLRGIYYKQRDYMQLHGKYADNAAEIKIEKLNFEDSVLEPEFNVTPNSYRVSIVNNNKEYSIREDGLVEVKILGRKE